MNTKNQPEITLLDFLNKIGLEELAERLQSAGIVGVGNLETMSHEEINEIVRDETLAHQLGEGLDKMRRQREEIWIGSLVDSHI